MYIIIIRVLCIVSMTRTANKATNIFFVIGIPYGVIINNQCGFKLLNMQVDIMHYSNLRQQENNIDDKHDSAFE